MDIQSLDQRNPKFLQTLDAEVNLKWMLGTAGTLHGSDSSGVKMSSLVEVEHQGHATRWLKYLKFK